MNFRPKQKLYSKTEPSAPLYNSRIVTTYLDYLKSYYPDIDLDSVFEYAGVKKYEVEDPGHWFSQQQIDRFYEVMVTKTGNPNIAREAGRYTISSERIGAARQWALGFINPASIYLMMGKLANSLTRGLTLKTKKLGPNKAEIVSIPKPGIDEKPYQCANRIGIIESIPKLFTDTFAEVEHPECFHEGADCCRYTVTWPKTPSLIWRRINKFGLFISLPILMISYFIMPIHIWAVFIPILICFCLMCFLYSEHLEKEELIRTVKTQGDAAKELLGEMNIRHNNARLIQEVGQSISEVLDIAKIIETVAKIIEKHSYFNRGMIMLANDQRTKLQFKAGFGYKDQEKILRTTEFNLDNPESTGILVRCFKEQEPFLINDVTEIEDISSKRSIEFIKQMNVESFICVPIVYKKESLGILAVDNYKSDKPLVQSDISLLMGVASQTATSIMNAVSFKQIRESEERYRLLADNVTDVIWILDIDLLKFSYISPSVQQMQGYTPEEFMQLALHDVLTPKSYRLVKNITTAQLMREESGADAPIRPRTLELEGYCKDGSKIWLEVTSSFLRDEGGRIIGILGVSRDISNRKRADKEKEKLENQLQRAQKMKAIGTLAGGVAHDLNNILSGILSYPELLLLDLPEDSPLRKPLETIQESGKKAAAIVQDLLTLARRGVAVDEVLNLNDIISEYLTSPEYEKLIYYHSDIELETSLDPGLLNIMGSPVHISKTIMNLVSNAAEAMPDGGKISITTENRYIDRPISGYDTVEEGDYGILKVSDTGIGIGADDLSRIFEPFYTKKVMGRSGTGLGMAVVWGTVKDHKGYIDVYSVPGKGTTFTLYFPITRQDLVKDKTILSVEDYKGHGESVLVIDDVKEQREIAFNILSQLGYRVHTVSSGEEAIAFMKNNTADLLVLDMIMGSGIDGLETYKQILTLHPKQKAIIASGFSETERVKEAHRLGAGVYIKKPYTIEKIGLALRDELNHSSNPSV